MTTPAEASASRCRAGHPRCHVPNGFDPPRGCGCCPCLRTDQRFPDCFGCTLPECACHVPYAIEEKPMTDPPSTRSLSHAGARTPAQRRTRGCRQPVPKPRKELR